MRFRRRGRAGRRMRVRAFGRRRGSFRGRRGRGGRRSARRHMAIGYRM